jgi:hypothetical protein
LAVNKVVNKLNQSTQNQISIGAENITKNKVSIAGSYDKSVHIKEEKEDNIVMIENDGDMPKINDESVSRETDNRKIVKDTKPASDSLNDLKEENSKI